MVTSSPKSCLLKMSIFFKWKAWSLLGILTTLICILQECLNYFSINWRPCMFMVYMTFISPIPLITLLIRGKSHACLSCTCLWNFCGKNSTRILFWQYMECILSFNQHNNICFLPNSWIYSSVNSEFFSVCISRKWKHRYNELQYPA